MQILRLRFKNLNSLAGEWSIDFSSPEFKNDGIFAIVGPTGAGKSTVLDAICLALYGRTPRIANISKSTNEIMSRHTYECMAELEFLTVKGRYRSFWHQHRAHSRSDGALQDVERELADLDTGKILISKSSEVSKEVENITGLNFDRFTRSIMLAQGGFAAFLQASSSERAPVLEQITGTDIYTDISIAVYKRNKDEQEIKKTLEDKLGDLRLFSAEEESSLRSLLKIKEDEGKSISAKLQGQEESLKWLQLMDELHKDLERLSVEKIKLAEKIKDFERDREKLKLAEKTRDIYEYYLDFSSSKDREKQVLEKRQSLEKTLPDLEKELSDHQELHSQTKINLEKLRLEEQKSNLLFIKVRAIDEKFKLKNTDLKNREKFFNKQKSKTELGEKGFKDLSETLSKKEQKVQEQKSEFAKSENYAPLLEDFSSLKLSKSHLDDLRTKLEKQKQLILQGKADLNLLGEKSRAQELDGEKDKENFDILNSEKVLKQKELAENFAGLKSSDLHSALNLIKDKKRESRVFLDEISRLSILYSEQEQGKALLIEEEKLAEYFKELQKDFDSHLEVLETREKDLEKTLTFASQVQNLEELRGKLVGGKECPLCGSTEHPWFAHKFENLELENEAEKLRADLLAARTNKTFFEKHTFQEQLRLGNLKNRLESINAELKKSYILCLDLAKNCDSYGSIMLGKKPELAKSDYLLGLKTFCDELKNKLAASLEDFKGKSLLEKLKADSPPEKLKAKSLQEDLKDEGLTQFLNYLDEVLKISDHLQKDLKETQERAEKLHFSNPAELVQKLSLSFIELLGKDLKLLTEAEFSAGKMSAAFDKITEQLEDLKAKENEVKEKLQKTEADLNSKKLRHEERSKSLQTEKNRFLEEEKEAAVSFNNLKTRIKAYMEPAFADHLKPTDLDLCLKNLWDKRQKYLTLQDELQKSEKELSRLKEEKTLAEAEMKRDKEQLASEEKEFKRLEAESKTLDSDRKDLFEEKSVDAVEQEMKKQLTDCEQEDKKRERASLDGQNKFENLKKSLKELLLQLREAKDKHSSSKIIFTEEMQKQGFASLEDYEKARLDKESLDSLRSKNEELEKGMDLLRKGERDKKEALQLEKDRDLSSETKETLMEKVEELKNIFENTYKEIGVTSEKLQHNELVKKDFSKSSEELDRQKKECAKWAGLNGLIGSYDGKLYRNFAQGLTFEVVVIEANKHLRKMSKRYRLERDKNEALELNVIDFYQAREVRSTRNLSGGESFIVSLALALGLAGIASRKIRIDSLFLDEGFGALDEDTLDLALEVLSQLPGDGKLIGVISHISALKERIRNKISVIPAAGGKSILKGLGCRRIS